MIDTDGPLGVCDMRSGGAPHRRTLCCENWRELTPRVSPTPSTVEGSDTLRSNPDDEALPDDLCVVPMCEVRALRRQLAGSQSALTAALAELWDAREEDERLRGALQAYVEKIERQLAYPRPSPSMIAAATRRARAALAGSGKEEDHNEPTT